MNFPLSYLLVLCSNIFFSTSTHVFNFIAKKNSPFWVAYFKAFFVLILYFLTLVILNDWHVISLTSLSLFLLSGFVGLNLSDVLLIKSFTLIGTGRTLMLFSFQPFFLGIASYFLFDQKISLGKFFAILMMIICLFLFIHEKKIAQGRYSFAGFAEAFLGVMLDGGGILLTRQAFELSPSVNPLEGTFYRSAGAFAGFVIIGYFFSSPKLLSPFLGLKKKEKWMFVLSCFFGCYLSLLFYLSALKYGSLAVISAISITSPVFASLGECLLERRYPSKYLLTALVFFVLGFACFLLSP